MISSTMPCGRSCEKYCPHQVRVLLYKGNLKTIVFIYDKFPFIFQERYEMKRYTI